MPGRYKASARCPGPTRFGGQPAGRHLGRDQAGGAHDLLPAAIIEGDDEGEAGVAGGQPLAFLDHLDDVVGEPLALADHLDADLGSMELRHVLADEAPQQRQQIAHLLGRTRPVLGAEAVERQIGNVEFDGGAHGTAHRLDALAVTGGAGQRALMRPTAIAIHDDSDMARCFPCHRIDFHILPSRSVPNRDHTCMISLSLCCSASSMSLIMASVIFWTSSFF